VPSGWVLTNISCDDASTPSSGNTGSGVVTFNVDAGENVTCTFTNTKNGSITIKKIMQGGTGTFTFTGSPSGTISTNNGTITQTVQPGTFTATETAPSGWVLTSISCDDASTPSSGNTGSGVVTFNVDAGENVICTFTNTKNGSITIKKVMVGGTGTFTFTGSPSGTISTNNGTITQSVVPGTYTSTETVPDDWVLTSISCDDSDSSGNTGSGVATFNIIAGENVTCTFTNTKKTHPSISTSLSGGGQSGTTIIVFTGTSVTDQATLIGASGTAGGTVTYTVYSGTNCLTIFASAGTKTVTSGVAPASDAVLFGSPGTFFWQAVYSGDGNNNSASSGCNDEQVSVVTPLHTLTIDSLNLTPQTSTTSPWIKASHHLSDNLGDQNHDHIVTTAQNIPHGCSLSASALTSKTFDVSPLPGGTSVTVAFKAWEIGTSAWSLAKKKKCTSVELKITAFSVFAVDAATLNSNTLSLSASFSCTFSTRTGAATSCSTVSVLATTKSALTTQTTMTTSTGTSAPPGASPAKVRPGAVKLDAPG
jgi:hypothetical protein